MEVAIIASIVDAVILIGSTFISIILIGKGHGG